MLIDSETKLPISKYHKKIQSLIKSNELLSWEVAYEKHSNEYDSNLKIYKGKKILIKVLRIHFRNSSYFVREKFIDPYLKLIKSQQWFEK